MRKCSFTFCAIVSFLYVQIIYAHDRGCFVDYQDQVEFNWNNRFKLSDINTSLCDTVYLSMGGLVSSIIEAGIDPYPINYWLWEHRIVWDGVGSTMIQEARDFKSIHTDIKILLSIDIPDSMGIDPWPLLSNSNTASKFAATALGVVVKLGLDGVLVRWSYPFYIRSGDDYSVVRLHETKNIFKALVNTIRATFQYDYAKSLYENATFPENNEYIMAVSVMGNIPQLDDAYMIDDLCKAKTYRIILEAFDMHGYWDSVTGHTAPLYATEADAAEFDTPGSVASMIEYVIGKGCDPKLISLGIIANGVKFSLKAPGTGSLLPASGGYSIPYSRIAADLNASYVTEIWDHERQVPYALNPTHWITYENKMSIGKKIAYARSKGIYDATMFVISSDTYSNMEYPLLNAMSEAVKSDDVLQPDDDIDVCDQGVGVPYDNQGFTAKLPKGPWDDVGCQEAALDELAANCESYLSTSATDAEYLGCKIIQNRNFLPLGVYPIDTLLDEDLQDIDFGRLNEVFDTCSIFNMIQSACFAYSRDTAPGHYSTSSYVNTTTYIKKTQVYFQESGQTLMGLDSSKGSLTADGDLPEENPTPAPTEAVDPPVKNPDDKEEDEEKKSEYPDVGVPNIGLKAEISITGTTRQVITSAKQRSTRYARFKRHWFNKIGEISMDGCLGVNGVDTSSFLKKSYLDLWRGISNINSTDEMLANNDFQALARQGRFLPTHFGFSIAYSGTTHVYYSTVSSSNEATLSEKFNQALQAKLIVESANPSTNNPTLTNTFKLTPEVTDITSSISGTVHEYGPCNFELLVKNPDSWNYLLENCAISAANDVANLPRASFIPENGFQRIQNVVSRAGVRISPVLANAYALYHSLCRCDDGANTYSCAYANGTTFLHGSASPCDKSFWRMVRVPADKSFTKKITIQSSDNFQLTSEDGKSKLQYLANGTVVIDNGITRTLFGSADDFPTGLTSSTLNYDPSQGRLYLSVKLAYTSLFVLGNGEMNVFYKLPSSLWCIGGSAKGYGLFLSNEGILEPYALSTLDACTSAPTLNFYTGTA